MNILRSCLALLLVLSVLGACGSSDTPANRAEPDASSDLQTGTQSAGDAVPAGWQIRTDDGSIPSVATSATEDADIQFAVMEPGFHVRMYRPRAIFWHPDSTAEGNYRARTTMHLFDPGQRREAHGLFVGGTNLTGPDQEYLYFLIRRTGEFLIKVRRGDNTETVVDWTAHEAVVPFNDDTEGTATNSLEIETMSGMVHFRVNGQDVHVSTDESLPVNGHFGFRLNHGLEVHIETLTAAE
ncbi:MAG: hypothetical protein COV99_11595 [Bacteroidetes bacterium CG12_big_fil_rev_8_21_14_0_65_60_17]|nr:MAG: hypothetical protein COV99_11595 [Bacteroidetes bacterium CG12_big_fil_rev_8_21_14_0_65_60_17]